MLDNLTNILGKLATGKNIIILLILMIVANAVVIPLIYPQFETLDLQSSYSPDGAYNLISSYGEQGRLHYAVIELTLDLFYPLISALLFSLFTAYTFRRIFSPQSKLQYLALIPLAVMLVDYFENISVVTMLFIFPQRIDPVAQAANLFTVTKFALSYVELALVLIGLIGLLAKKVLGIHNQKVLGHH